MKRIHLVLAALFFVAAASSMFAQNAKYKPSAAAIAADPSASDWEVKTGYTKSPAEFRGYYENYPDEYFLYKPYYEGMNTCFYYLGDEENNKIHDNSYAFFLMKAQNEYGKGYTSIMNFIGNIPGQGDRQVPYGEETIMAGFAEVVADPAEAMPLLHFFRSVAIMEVSAQAAISPYASRNANDKVVKTADQTIRLVESDTERLGRLRRLLLEVEDDIRQGAPFNALEFMADFIYNRYAQRKAKGQFVYFDYLEYKEAVSLLHMHPDAQNKADVIKKHDRQLEDVDYDRNEFYKGNASKAGSAASGMTMAQIPKAGMSDAAMESKLKAAAVTALNGANVVKVIIRDAGWNYDKDAGGRVTARWKGTYVIYKEGGKTYMSEVSFKQPATGGGSFGSWTFRGLGMDTRTITDWK